MANPLSLPYSLPPYRRVLLIAASFSVWHSSVRPSVPRWHFLSHFIRPIHSFGWIGQTCLRRLRLARLRSGRVVSRRAPLSLEEHCERERV